MKRNLPVKPEELHNALQAASAAGAFELPGEKKEASPENQPQGNLITRIGIAVVNEFDDEEKFYSAMTRITALLKLLRDDDRIRPYILETDDTRGKVTLHDAVVRVMARFPISEQGDLDQDWFFREVEKAANPLGGQAK